jgi:hypothetical protein
MPQMATAGDGPSSPAGRQVPPSCGASNSIRRFAVPVAAVESWKGAAGRWPHTTQRRLTFVRLFYVKINVAANIKIMPNKYASKVVGYRK